jgi:hypothetical protein
VEHLFGYMCTAFEPTLSDTVLQATACQHQTLHDKKVMCDWHMHRLGKEEFRHGTEAASRPFQCFEFMQKATSHSPQSSNDSVYQVEAAFRGEP